LLGGIAQRADAAEALVKKMRCAFAQIEIKTRRCKTRVCVYVEAWPNPRISSPPWVAELVAICGGEMVVPAGEKITDAQVSQARPDVIVLAWAATGSKADPKQAYKSSAWKDVPAIRNRNVFVIRDELLNTPGPPCRGRARTLSFLIRLLGVCLRARRRPGENDHVGAGLRYLRIVICSPAGKHSPPQMLTNSADPKAGN